MMATTWHNKARARTRAERALVAEISRSLFASSQSGALQHTSCRYDPAVARVLGVDLGLKRTGLAVSDELGLTARALPNLTPRSRAEDVAFLVGKVRELEVADVVVGLPALPRSGDEGPMARRARGFAAELQRAVQAADLPTRVHLVDESYSSRHAAERLVESGVKKSRRKEALDGEVARGLVLGWLAGGWVAGGHGGG